MTKETREVLRKSRGLVLDRIKILSIELRMLQAALPGEKVGTATARPTRAPARRRRKPMTPAQKRAVSVRMKKYWRDRKKAAGE